MGIDVNAVVEYNKHRDRVIREHEYEKYLEDTKYQRDDTKFRKPPSFEEWKRDKVRTEWKDMFLSLCDIFFGKKNVPIFSELMEKFVFDRRWRGAMIDLVSNTTNNSTQNDRTRVFVELCEYGSHFGLKPYFMRRTYI